MLRQRFQTQHNKLLGLDAAIKTSIASIGKLSDNAGEVKQFRDQLDRYQESIKENLLQIKSILSDLSSHSAYSSWLGQRMNSSPQIPYSMEQFNYLQESYRKVVYKASRQLESRERDLLVRNTQSRKSAGDAKNDADLHAVYESSVELTQDMTSCARRLAEEVKLGALNAELLEQSSAQIGQNYAELKDMGGQMGQSERLTSLAYRRRITSYFLYSLAFLFYFLSVAAIFLTRVPLGSWLLPSSYV